MGIRFRKSISLGGGLKLNLNKKFVSGVDLTIGTNYNQEKDFDANTIYSRNNDAKFNVQFSVDLWRTRIL